MVEPAARASSPPADAPRVTARALLLGDRLDTAGLERDDLINKTPLAFRTGSGYAVLLRYGVVVLIGLSPVEDRR